MIIGDNTSKLLFNILLAVVLFALLFTANNLSISYKEALNIFVNTSVLSIISNTSIYLFGQNDIALRLPFLIFYFLSIFLMFTLTKNFFKKESDRYISIILFMLLPGLLSASLLINSAIVVTFLTLLYIYYYEKNKKHCYVLLLLFLFVDNSFAIFFLALFFYAIRNKDSKLIVTSIILFGLSMFIYGFETGGKPRGFLVDTFAIYASIFSPLLFIYFFYTVYRNGIKKERSLIWYIATTSLIFSLVFSLRQRIYIEDYAPFVVIFIPYMVKSFFHSLRVRLPQFRYRHYYTSGIVTIVFVFSVLIIFINKPFYLFLEKPKKHFIYKHDIAKQLAKKLKAKGINEISTNDKKLLLRLKFYGIKNGSKYTLVRKKLDNHDFKISIDYCGRSIFTAYITKT